MKSRQLQLEEGVHKLEAQSAPPLTVGASGPGHRAVDQDPGQPDSGRPSTSAWAAGGPPQETHHRPGRGGKGCGRRRAPGPRGHRLQAQAGLPSLFVGVHRRGPETELVKRLAMDMFHSPESLIRLDMSEFMEKFASARIIASRAAVGYDEAGQLTEKVRRKPYCVVLFDEIEKAHPRRAQHPAPDPGRRPTSPTPRAGT